jgi:alpha-glucosidase
MDVGGFTGNPTVGLYTRWMQLGAFIPYFRNHTQFNTKSAEPWSFGEAVLETCRHYISLRYRLLPYLYSTFYEATQNGMPVVRSLAIGYTHDQKIYNTNYQNEFLFGAGFLVMPQESMQQYAKVYLPAGDWYNLYTDEREKGSQEKLVELNAATLPVYVKGGSIIPMQSLVQNTGERPTDTLTLHIYSGETKTDFDYYEDDGTSYNYEQGAFYKRHIQYDPVAGTVTLDAPAGNFPSKFKYLRIALHGFTGSSCQVNDRTVHTQPWLVSYLYTTPRPGIPYSYTVQSFVLENNHQQIIIKY